MTLINQTICTANNKIIGTIIKENPKSFSYGSRKYVKKTDFNKKWFLCGKRPCNQGQEIIFKESKGRLPLRVRKAIYPMSKECFPETYGNNTMSQFVTFSFFVNPSRDHYWLENKQGEIITYLMFDKEDDTIWNICTSTRFRRQKCMNQLFSFFMSRLDHRIKKLFLWVFKTNTIAINAYKKLGFRIDKKDAESYRMALEI